MNLLQLQLRLTKGEDLHTDWKLESSEFAVAFPRQKDRN